MGVERSSRARLALLLAALALITSETPSPAATAHELAGSSASTPPAVSLTADAIRAVLSERQRAVRAFHFVLEEKTLGDNPSRPSDHRREVGACEPSKFFYSVVKRRDDLAFVYDPYQSILIINGQDVVRCNPWSRQFGRETLAPDHSLPAEAILDATYLGLGLWPTAGLSPPSYISGTPVTLAQVVSNHAYTVQPRQEDINGRWCHVLELAGRDRLWVDVDHGGVLMKREILEPRNGRIAQKIIMDECAMVAPHIWWPMRISNTVFDPFATSTEVHVRATGMFQVVQVELNEDVDPKLFDFQPGPGYLQIFNVNDVRQVVPGGEELMTASIERLSLMSRRRTAPRATGPNLAAILCINAISSLGIVIFLMRRQIVRWTFRSTRGQPLREIASV